MLSKWVRILEKVAEMTSIATSALEKIAHQPDEATASDAADGNRNGLLTEIWNSKRLYTSVPFLRAHAQLPVGHVVIEKTCPLSLQVFGVH